jgi:hypothetical protein
VTTTAVEEEFVTCVAEGDDPQLTTVNTNPRVKATTKILCVAFFVFLLSQHKNAAGSKTANEKHTGGN